MKITNERHLHNYLSIFQYFLLGSFVIVFYQNVYADVACFQINNIEIIGEHTEQFNWLSKKASQYTHRCIDTKDINQIIHDLTKELIARGYVTTRLGIPAQNLKTKTLKIALIAGLLHRINTNDSYHYGTIWNALPINSGDILNVRDLEQGLDQLQRNSSQTATIDIVPTGKVGESDVIVKRKRMKPWHAVISIDNGGSVATGKIESSGMFSIDNLFGLTDSLLISINRDADSNSTRGINGNSVDYSVPFGYWTMGIAFDESNYKQQVEGTFQTFDTSGTSNTQSIRLQRLLHRNQSSKTFAQIKLLKRQNQSFIDEEEIDVQHQHITALELALQHQYHIGSALLDNEIVYRRGVPWFHAQDDWHGTDMPTTRYIIWSSTHTFWAPIQILKNYFLGYRTTLKAQYTKDRLFQTELFSIGNRYSIRGFDGEQTLASEKGFFIQNTVEFPIFKSLQTSYLGVDHGVVAGPAAKNLIGRQLTGFVTGLKGIIKKYINYDISLGSALQKPKRFPTKNIVLAFKASCQF